MDNQNLQKFPELFSMLEKLKINSMEKMSPLIETLKAQGELWKTIYADLKLKMTDYEESTLKSDVIFNIEILNKKMNNSKSIDEYSGSLKSQYEKIDNISELLNSKQIDFQTIIPKVESLIIELNQDHEEKTQLIKDNVQKMLWEFEKIQSDIQTLNKKVEKPIDPELGIMGEFWKKEYEQLKSTGKLKGDVDFETYRSSKLADFFLTMNDDDDDDGQLTMEDFK